MPPGRFDTLADRYEAYRTGYSDRLYETVLSAVPEGPRVLDLAAGTGLSSQPLQSHARRLVAADPAPKMLARAPVPHRVLARAERLPFANDSFDLVTCAQAFHWLEPSPTYRELRRVLAPEGRAAVWWKYPKEGDRVRELTDAAIERVLGRSPPHTPLVGEPLPEREQAPFAIETLALPFTMGYTIEDWLGYQASRSLLHREAGQTREQVLAAIEEELGKAFPSGDLAVEYDQPLHLLRPV